MALVIIKKNDIRVAQIQFHREVIDILKKFSNSYRLHEFEGELDEIGNKIKLDMRDHPNKNAIRKTIKGARKNMILSAKQSKLGNKISADLFFQNYFGGIPLDSKSLTEAPYDLIIEIEPHITVAWIFSTSKEENMNYSEIAHHVQCDFNKECTQVLTKYPVEINDIRMIEFESKESQIQENEQPQEENESEIEPKLESIEAIEQKIPEYIGRVEFGNTHKMMLQEKRIQDKIDGVIRPEAAAIVSPGTILAIESTSHDDFILATVVKIEVNRKNTATNFESYTYLGVKISMRPLIQKTENYLGKIVPTDLSGYKIRRPSSEELSLVTNIPKEGLPLGELDVDDDGYDAYYPFDPNSHTLNSTIYQSVFIAGIQGSGKTNGLKFMIQSVTGYEKIDYDKRPAVIVLDGENSFTDFTSNEKMHTKTKDYLEKHDIGKVNKQVYTLAENEKFADSTLSFESLTYNDIIYLMPELEAKTEGILLQILKMTFEVLKSSNTPITITSIRNEAMAIARSSGLIHFSQLPAIARALHSIELDLFNQAGKVELSSDLLFQPGQVSVIDIHRLDKNRRRVTALYILQLLSRFKMENLNKYPGVILVIDEAEQLFPDKPSKHERDFVDRIAERCEDITNRGRKRFYGLFLVSHLPSEVSPKVVALANTQMAFKCSGADPWISRVFGREYVQEINDLPIGTCRIKVNISTVDQKPINARIYLPNVDEVINPDEE